MLFAGKTQCEPGLLSVALGSAGTASQLGARPEWWGLGLAHPSYAGPLGPVKNGGFRSGQSGCGMMTTSGTRAVVHAARTACSRSCSGGWRRGSHRTREPASARSTSPRLALGISQSMICINASRMCCTSFQLLPVLVSISFQLRPTDLFVVSLNATFRRPSHIQQSQNVSYVTITCYRWPQLLPISCFQRLWQWSRLPNSACQLLH